MAPPAVLRSMMLVSLLFLIGVAFAQSQPAPDAPPGVLEPVIACLGIPGNEFERWHEVLGYSVWVGYERGGFAVPSDVSLYRRLTLETSVGQRYLWIAASPSTPDLYYVLPFVSMAVFPDASGEHNGVHPCGAFAVEAPEICLFTP